jgi:hypothetical protein
MNFAMHSALQNTPLFDSQLEHLAALERAMADVEYAEVAKRREVQKALEHFRKHSLRQGGVSLFYLGMRERQPGMLRDALRLIKKYANP